MSIFLTSAPAPTLAPPRKEGVNGSSAAIYLDSVQDAVAAIATGEFVVVVDDMDREVSFSDHRFREGTVD